MSRLRSFINPGKSSDDEPDESWGVMGLDSAADEFAHITKLRSEPHAHLRRVLPGLGEPSLLVSPVHMLLGREFNYTGRGRFSLSDSCHVLGRYLPDHSTPTVIDKMKSCAYVSQFSDDGSLFVAGFQV